jgi:AcrR family transcriptional regulator
VSGTFRSTLSEQNIPFQWYGGRIAAVVEEVVEVSRTPSSGRRAQASRNDERILAAAREVLVDDPSAPIAAVADAAGVGMSALYRRYPSKEALLHTICADGLGRYIAAVEAALADDGDPWEVFVSFMRRVVDADTHSLTQRLAGSFSPDDALQAEARRAEALNEELFDRTRAAGVLRPDLTVVDVAMTFELVAGVRLGERDRTRRLRHRYLALVLDGMQRQDGQALPAGPPTWPELSERWNPGVPAP